MIYLDVPFGNNYGWGICGKYITKELAGLTDITLIRGETELTGVDPMELQFFKQYLVPPEQLENFRQGRLTQVDSPVLQAVPYLFPSWGRENWVVMNPKGSPTVGYIFFDEDNFDPDYIRYLDDNWDVMIAGSTWCEETLRRHGLTRLTTVIQGIDPRIFHPQDSEKEYFQDRFVIFSGGKFEYRKGQDLVIKAYKVLQDKYKDVMLVNAWYNHWPATMAPMRISPHIMFQFPPKTNQWSQIVGAILSDNGIDLERVVTLPAYPNIAMARIYKNTDIGLFPNRREGGTNLVLMEYMACGKPVVASYNSGHKDVLTPENSLMVKTMIPRPLRVSETLVPATWEEADLDETIAQLEWAYHNRDQLKAMGVQAGADMAKNTWRASAEQFYAVLQPGLPARV